MPALAQGDRGVGRAAAEDRPQLRGRAGQAGRQPHLAEADAGEELAEGHAEVAVAGGGGAGRGRWRRRRWRRPEENAAGHGAY